MCLFVSLPPGEMCCMSVKLAHNISRKMFRCVYLFLIGNICQEPVFHIHVFGNSFRPLFLLPLNSSKDFPKRKQSFILGLYPTSVGNSLQEVVGICLRSGYYCLKKETMHRIHVCDVCTRKFVFAIELWHFPRKRFRSEYNKYGIRISLKCGWGSSPRGVLEKPLGIGCCFQICKLATLHTISEYVWAYNLVLCAKTNNHRSIYRKHHHGIYHHTM